jgi:ATP-dependent DNA helicase RecG
MALEFVRESGKITNADFRKLTNASERTALRDLDEMLAKGVFEKSSKKGRSAGYLLASKPAINPP